MNKQYVTWSEADFTWSDNEYSWNDVYLVLDLVNNSGGGGVFNEFLLLPKNKKDQFVTLILKVKGETIKQTKKKKRFKVTAKDVNLVIETVLKEVNITLKK
jgi:hypothetical protein